MIFLIKLNIANRFDYFSRREFVKIKFFNSVIIGIIYPIVSLLFEYDRRRKKHYAFEINIIILFPFVAVDEFAVLFLTIARKRTRTRVRWRALGVDPRL